MFSLSEAICGHSSRIWNNNIIWDFGCALNISVCVRYFRDLH